MSRMVTTTVAVALSLVSSAAFAQTDPGDGWDRLTDPDRGLTAATATFNSGHALVVRCQGRNLDILLGGLPEDTRSELSVIVTPVADSRLPVSWSLPPTGGTAYSRAPAFDARALRPGGAVRFEVRQVQTGQETPVQTVELPLPTVADGLDEVLSACDVPLFDPRDDLPIWIRSSGTVGFGAWERQPQVMYPSSSGAMQVRRGEVTASCRVAAEGRLVDCRIEYESPRDLGFGPAGLNALRSARLKDARDGGPEVGHIMYSSIRFRLE